ncbi:MAG: histone family protein [Archaeoglobaceae archaeon]
MAKLPVAPIERIMKKAGAERISEEAKDAMIDELEEYAANLARRANETSRYVGRKTVKAEDIKLASKE